MINSKIYNFDGEIEKIDTKFNDLYFFRKMTKYENEIKIYKILQKNNHPNIVDIYRFGIKCVDIEILNTNMIDIDYIDIRNILLNIKDHLQNLGIVYIDWKDDQFGIDKDGKLKLFDFDCSGIIDKNTYKWVVEPPKFFAYNKAIEYGIKDPLEIDNFSFNDNFPLNKA